MIRNCVVCGAEFTPKRGSNRKCCNNECSAISRSRSNTAKHGCGSPSSSKTIVKALNTNYEKVKGELETVDIYTKEETVDLLNSRPLNYTKYFGKAKNRTMIKDDPRLYKSLIHWSDEVIGDLIPRKPLSLRLCIVGEHRGIIGDELTCHCGRRLTFDPARQQFTKRFCRICRDTLQTHSHFENRYGSAWREKYEQYECERYDCYFGGIKSGKLKCSIGVNEVKLLNQQEVLNDCIINRSHRILNYLVDGYCEATNTVYEIYEYEHKYNREYDKQRLQNIVKSLNCNVKVIFDGWDGYDDWY